MFIEKVITKTIFDPEVFKVGNKVRAKYQCAISDDYIYWEYDFIGIVKYCCEDILFLEDPDDRDYDIFSDESRSRQYKVELPLVKAGFWVLDLL